MSDTPPPAPMAFDFRVHLAGALPPDALAAVFALFESNYRDANRAYLERSLTKLRYAAIATHEGQPAGFGLGETRRIDLPGLPRQLVRMAGICCVAPAFRRQGLFGKLEQLALSKGGPWPGEGRMLTSGRMAHPASMRSMSRNPTVVPKPGVAPTPWQREVGTAIAAAYGVAGFDPDTFVCKGSGEPIGYPLIEIEVEPEEWRVFEPVDRDRGDALLALAWYPNAPPGW